jgi:hypothetical protein
MFYVNNYTIHTSVLLLFFFCNKDGLWLHDLTTTEKAASYHMNHLSAKFFYPLLIHGTEGF